MCEEIGILRTKEWTFCPVHEVVVQADGFHGSWSPDVASYIQFRDCPLIQVAWVDRIVVESTHLLWSSWYGDDWSGAAAVNWVRSFAKPGASIVLERPKSATNALVMQIRKALERSGASVVVTPVCECTCSGCSAKEGHCQDSMRGCFSKRR